MAIIDKKVSLDIGKELLARTSQMQPKPSSEKSAIVKPTHNKLTAEKLTADNIELIINQSPYSIMCHPVSGIKSKDDSNQYDIYCYQLIKLEVDSLVRDLLEYFIATKGELNNRRACLITSDENNTPVAYVLEYVKPNFHARDILLTEFQKLDSKSLNEKLKILSSKEALIPCYQVMYYSITFKYIGMKEISKNDLITFKNAFEKISKKPPLNPSYSRVCSDNEFYNTVIGRIVSLLFYGNENIEIFFKDQFFDMIKFLKVSDEETANRLTILKNARAFTHALAMNEELLKIEKEKVDFSFKFQFLSKRNNYSKFSAWLKQSFESEIILLKDNVLKFSQHFNIHSNNFVEQNINSNTTKLIKLFSVLQAKTIVNDIIPNFYLDFLNFYPNAEKLTELLDTTFQKLARWSKSRFNKLFIQEYLNAENSYNALIKDSVARVLKYQMLLQSRKINHQVVGKDYVALQTIIKHDKIIHSLINGISSTHILKNYLDTLSLKFINDFLIESDRLKWIIKLEDDIEKEKTLWLDEVITQIDKLKSSNYQKVLNACYYLYSHSLPYFTAQLSSTIAQPLIKQFASSNTIANIKQFIKEQCEDLLIYQLLNYFLYDNVETNLSEQACKKLSYLYHKTTAITPQLLGHALGIYLTPSISQLMQIVLSSIAIDETIQYFNRPKLNERDSVIIYKPLKTQTQSILNYYFLSAHKTNAIESMAITEAKSPAKTK